MKDKLTLFVALLFACSLHNGYAQTKNTSIDSGSINTPQIYVSDSAEITDTESVKSDFNENDSILKWKKSRDFAYMQYLDSLLRKQKDIKSDTVRFDEASGKIIRNQKRDKEISSIDRILNSLPIQIFFWLLAIAFILFISYKVFYKNGIFSGKKRNRTFINEDEPFDNVENALEYDLLIKEAENKYEYNRAIRYLFLKALKSLSDNGFLSITIEKTNQEYLKEMKKNNCFEDFNMLVRNYEYTWYGKHQLDKNQYERLKEKFYLFNQKLNV